MSIAAMRRIFARQSASLLKGVRAVTSAPVGWAIHDFKMRCIDAACIPAKVVYRHVWWNLADSQLVDKAMRSHGLTAMITKLAIPVFVFASQPEPAFSIRWAQDFGPKTFTC